MYKKAGNHYLKFTRKERTGIFVLLSIILVITSIPFFYPFIFKQGIINHGTLEEDIAALKAQKADSSRKSFNYEYNEENYRDINYPRKVYNRPANGIEFEFDPNSTSPGDWKRLGISDRTIATIQRYLSKGGKFREPGDLEKIWGLHEDDIKRLIPYVRISEQHSFPGNSTYERKIYNNKTVSQVDINTSDSTSFIELPGIGNKLSRRIITFREKLGGFYTIDQVGETFGLPDSVFQKIRPNLILTGEIKKININSATVDEMKNHPYIRYNLANAIVQYRTQNGTYTSVTDIKKIMIVDEVLYKKLSPYLIVQ